MINHVSFFDPEGYDDWVRQLANLRDIKPHGLFVMVGEMTPFNHDDIKSLFKKLNIPVFGGIFPGLIHGGSWRRKGVLLCSFACPVTVRTINKLDNIEALPDDKFISPSAKTMLLLVDGMACNVSSLLNRIYENVSTRVSYIGGGAGKMATGGKGVLFNRDVCFSNGALLVSLEEPLGVGAGHGCVPIYGPLVANKTSGNVMLELNWRPAFESYRKIIKERAGVTINRENFFEVAREFPLGMVKIDDSIIVRDPIKLKGDDSMVVVGELHENSVLMLLRGEPDHLIKAAGEAALRASQNFRDQSSRAPRGSLVINCISRALYLGDAVESELRTIRSKIPPGLPVFGFLSLGEIASSGDNYLEFYNKTIVVGVG